MRSPCRPKLTREVVRYNAAVIANCIRIIRHSAVPDTGSYEVKFADGVWAIPVREKGTPQEAE